MLHTLLPAFLLSLATIVPSTEIMTTLEDPKIPADTEIITLPSGLQYSVLKAGGQDASPTLGDKVLVHYTGWTTNGKVFDSSVLPGLPQTLGLTDVIPGWTEGLQLMVEGERTRFWIPEELAYKGKAGRPQGMLVFDVQLLEILN